MKSYQDDILSVIGYDERISSEEIARRLGVIRNCILQDLYQLHADHRLEREQIGRSRGGIAYIYWRPALVPWAEWPAWTLMSGPIPQTH